MPLQELQAAQNDLLQLRDELKEAFGVLGCLNQIEAVCISDASVFEPQVFESIYTGCKRSMSFDDAWGSGK